LLGGDNLYQYAANPTKWFDSLGLKPCKIVQYKKDKVTPKAGGRQTGINRAFKEEAELLRKTGSGTYDWTPDQAQELLSTGKVSSVTGLHINSVASNPDWAGDSRNIVFLDNDGGKGGDHLYSDQVTEVISKTKVKED